MRTLAALAVLLAGCAATADSPSGRVIALPNSDFEAEMSPPAACPPRWNCAMHANPQSFRFTLDAANAGGGSRSLRIEPAEYKEPWAVVTQVIRDVQGLHGARVRFSLAVRTEGLVGKGGGPLVVAQYGHGGRLASWVEHQAGTSGWKRMQVEFVVPKETALLELGAVLEGAGKLWIDDARFEVLDAGPVAKKPV